MEEHKRFVDLSVEWAQLHKIVHGAASKEEKLKAASRMEQIDKEQESMLNADKGKTP